MYIEKERGKGQLSQSASFLKASFQISLKWDMADFFYVFLMAQVSQKKSQKNSTSVIDNFSLVHEAKKILSEIN